MLRLLAMGDVSALVGVLRQPLPPLCPELATGFPINVVSLIWDGGVSDLTTGWDGSCNFTCPSHGGRINPGRERKRSLSPLCPEPPPVSPPDFISLLWDEGIRDTTTGWDRSCGVTPPWPRGACQPRWVCHNDRSHLGARSPCQCLPPVLYHPFVTRL
jgi:hypothetical protein